MRDDPALIIHELAAELARSADALLRSHNITYARYRVLRAVRTLGDGVPTQHAIAERLGIGDASLSRTLPALTAAGWCEVRDDPNHGRRRVLRLTTSGVRLERDCARLLTAAFLGAATDAEVNVNSFLDAAEALTRRITSSMNLSPAQQLK